MHVPGRYWSIGVTTAVVVHIAIATAMFWQPSESGARSAGLGGVEVSLGPSGGSPGSVAADARETTEAETVEPVETAPTSQPREASESPPESVTAQPVEEVTSEPAVPVENAQPVEKLVEREPEVMEPVPEPPEPEQQPVKQEAAPEPATQPEETPQDVDPAEIQVAKAPSVAGAQGKAGTRTNEEAGSANDVSGGGVPGASADYMALLRAWLEKHKQYPRRAQRLRQEGTALLYFVMDREGRVLEYSIRQSSGHEILDEEVTAMIERAQPLPKIPDDMDQGRLELVVPVQFFLL